MKNIIILFFASLLILSCGVFKKNSSNEIPKDKRLYGEIILEDETINDNSKWYMISLTKNRKQNTNKKKLIYDSTDSNFDITISSSDLMNYKYVEFLSVGHERQLLKISELSNEFETVKLIKSPTVIIMAAKPAIYLYPITKRKISITHDFKGKIMNTYPKYNNGWNVIAEPNGKLLNISNNREFNYLFWDGFYSFPSKHFEYKTGFYVKKDDLIDFLQTKLAIIGLNNTEINDFVVYWLPILNKNKYNFIHFRINDNIDNISFLNVKPKPDTEIRVFMEFKGITELNEKVKIPEQNLKSIVRKGFTLVEWGGANIDSKIIE